MASLPIDYSALNGLRRQENNFYEIELEGVQVRSRPTSNFTSVDREFGDDDSLLKHGLSTPTDESLKTGKEINIVQESISPENGTPKTRRLQGWRFGVALSATVATSVLLTNTILTIWASARFPLADGLGTAFTGECSTVNSWAMWLHILINALSSILLSASNYTMQALSSPTRRECDRAHARGDWLDIGVAGVRNLSRISWQRRVLWVLLGCSSVPIHLLYNSAIFKTLDANQYQVVVANAAFFEGGGFDPWYGRDPPTGPNRIYMDYVPKMQPDDVPKVAAVRDAYNADPGLFETLEPEKCIEIYGKEFISGHAHVLVMTNEEGTRENNTVFFDQDVRVGQYDDPYWWICEDLPQTQNHLFNECDISSAKKNATNWTIGGKKIDHCLSQKTAPRCKLQFSTQILIAVIVCNAVKSAAMLWTLYRQREVTLVTVGDAIANWLDVPDETTKGRCLNSKKDLQKGPTKWQMQTSLNSIKVERKPPALIATFAPNLWPWLSTSQLFHSPSPISTSPNTTPPPTTHTTTLPLQWRHAISRKRWALTLTLCLSTLIATTFLLLLALPSIRLRGNDLLAFGFSSINSDSLISTNLPDTGSTGLICSVLLANTPQALVSFLYLLYNGLFTCMHLAHEFSGYAVRRLPLRVTSPTGAQRSTYWLQLPYVYGVPLIVASGTLHWLISQAIFLARIQVYVEGVEDGGESVSAVGYSCPPIVCLLVLGGCMLAVAVGMGFRRLQSCMPVAGSCSVVIAAAAHGMGEEADEAVREVKWGVVEEGDVGHCSFSAGEVGELVVGSRYAGRGTYAERRGGVDYGGVRKRL